MVKRIFFSVLVALLLVLSLSLTTAVPVMASSTLILRPEAAGDETSIDTQNPGSGSHWDKVDETSADDFATYLQTYSPTYQRDLYNLPNHTTESGTINSITIYFRIFGDFGGTAYAKPSQKSGVTVTDGTEQSQALGIWGTKSETYTTNPATGLAYTWAEIDALQIGVSLKYSDIADWTDCTQVYVEVDYTPVITPPVAVGGIVFPINKAYVLLPWIGAAGILALIAGFGTRYFIKKYLNWS